MTDSRPTPLLVSRSLNTFKSIPAAIGAKLAAPTHTVIDIDRDGSFLMTGLELITAVQYKIGVKVLVLKLPRNGSTVARSLLQFTIQWY